MAQGETSSASGEAHVGGGDDGSDGSSVINSVLGASAVPGAPQNNLGASTVKQSRVNVKAQPVNEVDRESSSSGDMMVGGYDGASDVSSVINSVVGASAVPG